LIIRILTASNIRTILDADGSREFLGRFLDDDRTRVKAILEGDDAEVELPVSVHGTSFAIGVAAETFDAHFQIWRR